MLMVASGCGVLEGCSDSAGAPPAALAPPPPSPPAFRRDFCKGDSGGGGGPQVTCCSSSLSCSCSSSACPAVLSRRSGMRLCISKLSTDLRTGICHEEASLLEISRALRKSRNASWKTEDGRRENGLTDLAFERLFLAEALQMLFRYSDGLSKVLESALANLGGMNGSTMCLLTR